MNLIMRILAFFESSNSQGEHVHVNFNKDVLKVLKRILEYLKNITYYDFLSHKFFHYVILLLYFIDVNHK